VKQGGSVEMSGGAARSAVRRCIGGALILEGCTRTVRKLPRMSLALRSRCWSSVSRLRLAGGYVHLG
jgi:hypothetical protein